MPGPIKGVGEGEFAAREHFDLSGNSILFLVSSQSQGLSSSRLVSSTDFRLGNFSYIVLGNILSPLR